jgi:hypothetical protein
VVEPLQCCQLQQCVSVHSGKNENPSAADRVQPTSKLLALLGEKSLRCLEEQRGKPPSKCNPPVLHLGFRVKVTVGSSGHKMLLACDVLLRSHACEPTCHRSGAPCNPLGIVMTVPTLKGEESATLYCIGYSWHLGQRQRPSSTKRQRQRQRPSPASMQRCMSVSAPTG